MVGNISPKVLYFKLQYGWMELHPYIPCWSVLLNLLHLSVLVAMSTTGDKILDTALSKVRSHLGLTPVFFTPLHTYFRIFVWVIIWCLMNAWESHCVFFSFYYLDWREELVHQRVGECSREERVSVCGVSCGWQRTGFTLLYQHTPTVRDSLWKAFAF